MLGVQSLKMAWCQIPQNKSYYINVYSGVISSILGKKIKNHRIFQLLRQILFLPCSRYNKALPSEDRSSRASVKIILVIKTKVFFLDYASFLK